MRCSVSPRHHTLLLATAMIIAGAFSTVSRNVSCQMEGDNIYGQRELYDKAWVAAFFMFLGETICLAIFYIKRCTTRRRASAASLGATAGSAADSEQRSTAALNDVIHDFGCVETAGSPRSTQMVAEDVRKAATGSLPYWKFVLAAIGLTVLDLMQTSAFNVAMVCVPASAVQIFGGLTIVFCLVLAIPLLRRKLERWEIMGVCFTFLGVALAGVATTVQRQHLEEYENAPKTIVGVLLVVAGQHFSGTQYIMEERLVKSQGIDPLMVLGWEGVCDVILSLCVACPLAHVIPGSDHGSLENYANSLYMSFANGHILAMNALYVLSILFFGWSGVTVEKLLTSTHRSLFGSLRSPLIRVAMVIMYYSTRGHSRPYGEPLTLYSLLELFGFGVMILGVMIHNDVRGFGAKATCRGRRGEEPKSPS
ncbi:Hypothetical protein GLP15_1463 [Giardia lamblia P15]|uniref:Integral membrane protein n=1 Tax=Giardia intestinalis (strain P15) TaxID=658858 RepID=E1F8N5_GIAIA|nr:Hypothetical protein GLP15_1463 [Giardia lamblia P15]